MQLQKKQSTLAKFSTERFTCCLIAKQQVTAALQDNQPQQKRASLWLIQPCTPTTVFINVCNVYQIQIAEPEHKHLHKDTLVTDGLESGP